MQIFKATLNTRPILEDSLKYIRSDVPAEVSEGEKNWLLSHNITTVLDLRTEEERSHKPCPLMTDGRFSYHSFPVTGGNTVPASADDVSKSYIAMVDSRFHNMVGFLLEVDSNVLYFCNAGKDRTGVLSAALLSKLGMSEDYIIQDYMRSKNNMEILLNAYAKQNPNINIQVITPQAHYIREFLDWYKTI